VPLLLLLCFLVLDNWTINVLNLYTGGLSLANIVARMGRFWATLLVSVAGVALSVTPSVVDRFNGLMTLMGNVFAPIAGVLLADYLLVKRMQISVGELFDPSGRYRYWAGFNLVALAWTAIGCVVYWATPASWVQNVVTIVATFVGYALTVRVVAPRTSRIPVAEAGPPQVPVGEESHG
jgi:purine-cytosine permease-like protein